MKDFRGKSAVVTGAGSGIGLGLARTFAAEGMSVALLDNRVERVDRAATEVRRFGVQALPLCVDVTDRKALANAAGEVERAFGAIHVVCNNAGVLVFGKRILETTFEEWDRILATNLVGEINVVETFVPRMLTHGEPAHVVNTSSIGGFQVRGELLTGAYSVSKYGVVALTESLAHDLAGTNVGVSILAPAAANTDIYGSPDRTPEELRKGMSGDLIGRRVLAAIRDGDLYVFTHVATKAWLERRHQQIVDAYAATERWAKAEGLLEKPWVAGGSK